MAIIKIAKIKNGTTALKAFQISKEVIDDLHYGNCKGIKDAIDTSEPGVFKLDNEEMGHFGATVREGAIIRYEEHHDPIKCPAGWNLWSYTLPATVKSPTEIYGKVEPRDAIFFDNIVAAKNFIQENSSSEYFSKNITITDKEVKIKIDSGISVGKIGQCFIVKYAKDDLNVLTLGTPSVDEYYILDAEGKATKCLNQY